MERGSVSVSVRLTNKFFYNIRYRHCKYLKMKARVSSKVEVRVRVGWWGEGYGEGEGVVSVKEGSREQREHQREHSVRKGRTRWGYAAGED